MKDIVEYLKREIRIRKDQLEYCEKYNDTRQAKFIRNNIKKLEGSINILSTEVDTNNEKLKL